MQQFNNAINTPAVLETAGEEESFDLMGLWRVIQRRKWGVIGLAAFITLLVGVVVYMMTPIYSSSVSVLIEPNKIKLASSFDPNTEGPGSDKGYYQTQAEMMRSRALMEAVVDRLKLTSHPLFNAPAKHSFLEGLLTSLGSNSVKPLVPDEKEAKRRAASQLAGMMKVELSRTSQLITISVESSDRVMAAMIANAIADTYIELDMEARYKMSHKATSWLNERLVALRANLDKSNAALQAYREKHNIVASKGVELGGVATTFGASLGDLAAARSEREQAQISLEQVRRAKGAETTIGVIQSNPVVEKAMSLVAERERKFGEMANRYGEQNPKLIAAQAELKQAKENLRLKVADAISQVEHEYEAARAKEAAISGSVSQAKQVIQVEGRKEVEVMALERDVANSRELYDLFLGQLKGASAIGDLQTVVARVVDPAVASDTPIKPNKKLILASAFVLSLLLGVAIAFALEFLDNSVRSAEDAERKLGLPMLAAVPLVEMSKGQNAGLYYRDAPKSLFAEAIKTIRTGILLSGIDHPKKTLLVTSSVPGEGKSTVAINLAMAHAQTKRVLLIDADMRRPSIAKSLGLDNTHPGLSMLVLGMKKLEDCVYKIEGSSLDVLTAGSIPPNPLELLISDKFKELLTELGGRYDTIIIDSPPVQLVSDAVILASMATGVVFVLKADATPFQLARRAIQSLQRGGASMFGVVLNQANFKNEEYYGGYGKYNYHAYYGQDADKIAVKV
jgi:capsular exopolysaccharide synthesis family protein